MPNTPEILPMLSRGKHRNPKRGACFMELAGFLAGERWSDHPSCTHPLLAELARQVNDRTSDAGRPLLAPLIPSVIGLTSKDPRWDHEIALLTATTALPLVPPERRASLAVGLLTCERLLSSDGAPVRILRPSSEEALRAYPIAAAWARSFAARSGLGGPVDHPGLAMVSFAVQAIHDTRRPDVDDLLRSLLTEAVQLCRDLADAQVDVPVLEPDAWMQVCSPARVAV
jgi:hypothetical protein